MATQKHMLSVEIAKKLSCNYCQGYLSCGPIKMQGNKNICGRCPTKDGVEVILQPVLECAMAQFKFPCKFEKDGCRQQIQFNETQEHEAKCVHRTLSCPALNCSSTIFASDLYQHFQSDHSNCIIENDQIRLDLLKSQNQNLLKYESDCIVIVKYCFSAETKKLLLSMVPIVEKNMQLKKYELEIINGTDLESSVKFASRNCQASNSQTLLEHDEINLNDYMSTLNSSSFVLIKMSLLFDDYEESAEAAFRKNTCNKCYWCSFFCYCNGYSNVSEIPCVWRGCKRKGNRKEILKHRDECDFKVYVCPFSKCNKETLFTFDSFTSHLKIHAQRYTNPDKIIIPLFNANMDLNKEKCFEYFTVIQRSIVRITCKVENFSNWTLLCSCLTDIQVHVYLSHDHCRMVIKPPEKCGKSVKYCKTDISYPNCFSDFQRLKASLTIKHK